MDKARQDGTGLRTDPVTRGARLPDDPGSRPDNVSRFARPSSVTVAESAAVPARALRRRDEPQAHRRVRERAAEPCAARLDVRGGAGRATSAAARSTGISPAAPTCSRRSTSRRATSRSTTSEDRLRPRGRAGARDPDAALGRRRPEQGAAAPARRSDRRRGAADRGRLLGRGVPRGPRGQPAHAPGRPGELPRDAARDAGGRHRDPAGGAPGARGHDRRAPARRGLRAAPAAGPGARGRRGGGQRRRGPAPTSPTRRPRRCRSRPTTRTTSTPRAACGRRARRPRSSRTCCRRASSGPTAPSSRATCSRATRSAATGSTTPRTRRDLDRHGGRRGQRDTGGGAGVRRARRVPLGTAPVARPAGDHPPHGHGGARVRGDGDGHDDHRLLGAADVDVLVDLVRRARPDRRRRPWRGGPARGASAPAVGRLEDDAELVVRERRLADGDRLVLVSDGIVDRAYPEGNALSINGVVDAVRDAPFASAAGAVSAVEAVIHHMSPDELLDDATIAVLDPGAARVTGIEHRLLDVPGGRIHVAEQGSGPLVVLVHGFPECWYSWRHQLPALADAGYHAVAVDVRGYGRSSKPAAVDAYRLVDHVADTAGVVRALGAGTATVDRPRLGVGDRDHQRAAAPGPVRRRRDAERPVRAARRPAADGHLRQHRRPGGVLRELLPGARTRGVRDRARRPHVAGRASTRRSPATPSRRPTAAASSSSRTRCSPERPVPGGRGAAGLAGRARPRRLRGRVRTHRPDRRAEPLPQHRPRLERPRRVGRCADHAAVAVPRRRARCDARVDGRRDRRVRHDPARPGRFPRPRRGGHWIQQERPDEVNRLLVDWLGRVA